MTSEHIRQMRELRAEKNKLEAERDHWMNEAIELRRDLESLKQSESETIKLVREIAETSERRGARIRTQCIEACEHAHEVVTDGAELFAHRSAVRSGACRGCGERCGNLDLVPLVASLQRKL